MNYSSSTIDCMSTPNGDSDNCSQDSQKGEYTIGHLLNVV